MIEKKKVKDNAYGTILANKKDLFDKFIIAEDI
jgi:hypothetical protein